MYRKSAFLFQLLFALNAFNVAADKLSDAEQADIVIIGGGLSGLVLANRLSEDRSRKITVLEAGPDGTNEDLINIPALAARSYNQTQYAWNFTCIPQAGLNGLKPLLPQGHTLGGGSAVNQMQYCRGAGSIYDQWATITQDSGWKFKNLFPYFRRSVRLDPVETNETVSFHPHDFDHGPLRLSFEQEPLNFSPYFLNLFRDAPTHPLSLVDFNNGTGIGYTPSLDSIRDSNRTRSYSLPAFGYPLAHRKRVNIIHNALVKKILFTGKCATGVEYISALDNRTYQLIAKQEVILSAGAINSPKILMLSGIGPKEHLQEHGIPVILDAPGVGSHLQDQPVAPIILQVTPNITTSAPWAANQTLFEQLVSQFKKNHTGQLSIPQANGFAQERVPDWYLKAHNDSYHLHLPKDRPHLFYAFVTAPYLPVAPAGTPIVTVFASVIQPESSGNVRLASADYRDDPLINPNYLGSENDLTVLLWGYKRLRSLVSSSSLNPVRVAELFPGKNVTSDADIISTIKMSTSSFHHPVRTVALGDALDNQFRLKGVEGLRVVDSSAIPVIPACLIQASVYALAERAADLIKDSWVVKKDY